MEKRFEIDEKELIILKAMRDFTGKKMKGEDIQVEDLIDNYGKKHPAYRTDIAEALRAKELWYAVNPMEPQEIERLEPSEEQMEEIFNRLQSRLSSSQAGKRQQNSVAIKHLARRWATEEKLLLKPFGVNKIDLKVDASNPERYLIEKPVSSRFAPDKKIEKSHVINRTEKELMNEKSYHFNDNEISTS